MRRYYLILFLIIIVAFFLRIWQLGAVAPSLTWDEVAWGYNAYSLGIDGRDEFGRFLPHDYLESFGDYKPPVYAYLDIIPVKLFGLNEFSVRLPSALFGTLTVFLTYFLVKRIFPLSKNKELYALLSAGVLAISPWHIMLSRTAFEANVASFFIVAGVWLFLAAMQEKKWLLPLSAVSFVISVYTFNSPRVVAPILVLCLAFGFWKVILKRINISVLTVIIGLILILPTARFLLSPQASLRFQEVNIFTDLDTIKTINQEVANDGNSKLSKIIHNRRLVFGVEYLKHYFDHFNPGYLFVTGDINPKFSTQDVGELYLLDLPFLLLGILFLFRKRDGNWWIIPVWLLIGIIPAATARQTPHALRTETVIPTMQILVAYGLAQVIIFVKRLKKKVVIEYGLLTVGCLLYLLNFIYFYHGYLVHYPAKYSDQWQYGYKDAYFFAKNVENNYSEIHITQSLGRPYIYYLFYNKIDPRVYRQEAKISRDYFGFVTVSKVGKYYFGDNVENIGSKNGEILYIDTPNNIPKGSKIVKTFNYLNGKASLVAFTII